MQTISSASDEDFRRTLRAVFNEVPEDIRERFRTRTLREPDDTVASQRILNAHGLATPNWPQEWGGASWTVRQQHIYLEELGMADVPEPLTFNVDMVGPVIAEFGSDEQKQRFLPATANLDIWWCQGFSEPEAGSDLASLKTRAVREGSHYIVNGQKTWTTLAQHADWMFALVRTDPYAPKRQAGISFLLIDMTTPGITVRPIELLDGSCEVNEVFFSDVRVPAENLVGQENLGWSYAKFLLGHERARIARVGQIRNSLAWAKSLAAGLAQGDGTLLDDPLLRARVAELETELLALEATQLRAMYEAESGKAGRAGAILKLRGSELQERTAELVMDIAGPLSLATDGPEQLVPQWAQRSLPLYLTERRVGIYGGSDEVQRMVIASQMFGL
jgi:alkylation response protein AidB-like acyl-CoA dehydrogenase